MNTRRGLIGAVQGAVVAIAVVVVALTYLTPGDDPSLFGVNSPGGEQPPSLAPAHPPDDPDAKRERTDQESVATGARPLGFTGRPGGAIVPSPAAASSARHLAPANGDGIAPTDDQYIDTLARLEAALATGG